MLVFELYRKFEQLIIGDSSTFGAEKRMLLFFFTMSG